MSNTFFHGGEKFSRGLRHPALPLVTGMEKCNRLCCNVGCHVFRNRQRKIWRCEFI